MQSDVVPSFNTAHSSRRRPMTLHFVSVRAPGVSELQRRKPIMEDRGVGIGGVGFKRLLNHQARLAVRIALLPYERNRRGNRHITFHTLAIEMERVGLEPHV